MANVKITKNGPYLVSGGLPLAKEIITTGKEGIPTKWSRGEKFPQQEEYALCRCGHSKNKPYCTGTHAEVDFNGTETALRKSHAEQAEKTEGDGIDLMDAVAFCASSRFCDLGDGTWKYTEDSKDPKAKKEAIRQACCCPSGRLVMLDKKAGKAIEPGIQAIHKHSGGSGSQRERTDMVEGEDPARIVRRYGVRDKESGHSMPLRPVREQAVLRRHACPDMLQRRGQAAEEVNGKG